MLTYRYSLMIPMFVAVSIGVASSHVSAEDGDDSARQAISHVLSEYADELDLISNDDRSFAFTVSKSVRAEAAQELPWKFDAASIGGRARVVYYDSDGLPYSMLQNDLLCTWRRNDGEEIEAVSGGGVRVDAVIRDDDNDGEYSLSVTGGYTAGAKGVSRVEFPAKRILAQYLDRAETAEWDAEKRVATLHTDNSVVTITFAADAKALYGIMKMSVESGGVMLTVDNFRFGEAVAVPDARSAVKLWQIAGYPSVLVTLRNASPMDYTLMVPARSFKRSDVATKRMKQLQEYLAALPQRSMSVYRPEELKQLPQDVADAFTLALELGRDRDAFKRLDQVERLLTVKDVRTRAVAMSALGAAKVSEPLDKAKINDLLLKGIDDPSHVVRLATLNTVAGFLYSQSGIVDKAKIVPPLVSLAVDEEQTALTLRPIVYSLQQLQDGQIDVGKYPTNEHGWPTYDEEAIAWWVIHADHVRARVAEWAKKATGAK